MRKNRPKKTGSNIPPVQAGINQSALSRSTDFITETYPKANHSKNPSNSQLKSCGDSGDKLEGAQLFDGFSGGCSGEKIEQIPASKSGSLCSYIEGYELSPCEQGTYEQKKGRFEGFNAHLSNPEITTDLVKFTCKVSSSLDRLDSAKKTVQNFCGFLEKQDFQAPENLLFGLKDRFSKMCGCGDWQDFRYYTSINRITKTSYHCQEHLACPVCAIRRSARLLRSYLPKVFEYLRVNPGVNPYLLTFTVPNSADLKVSFNQLQSSFRSLMKKAYYYKYGKSRGRSLSFVEMSKVEGAIASYEMKRGSNSGLWHPHIHVLAFSPSDFDFNRLRAEWSRSVGVDVAVVNVQRVRYDRSILDLDLNGEIDEDLLFNNKQLGGSLLEVLKYPLKFTNVPFEDNLHLWRMFKGARLLQTYGKAFKAIKVNTDADDAEELKDLPYIRLLFMWNGNNYEYDSFGVSRSV